MVANLDEAKFHKDGVSERVYVNISVSITDVKRNIIATETSIILLDEGDEKVGVWEGKEIWVGKSKYTKLYEGAVKYLYRFTKRHIRRYWDRERRTA
jgi:hypothetical protein